MYIFRFLLTDPVPYDKLGGIWEAKSTSSLALVVATYPPRGRMGEFGFLSKI